MTILTENNGFQNIGKCLEGRCDSIDQISDFIQYCIEFIFYDDIRVTGVVSKQTTKDTKVIIDHLHNDYNFPIINFETIDDDSDVANKLVEDVSKVLASKIKTFSRVYPDLNINDAKKLVPELSKEHHDLLIGVTEAIKNKDDKIFIDYEKISKFSVDSCFFKIVNKDVLKELFIFSKKSGWNEAMSYYLLSELRYLTNKAFVDMNNYIFLPSTRRGKEEYKRRITNKINEIIKKGLLIYKIEMPSIMDYIIQKGKGKPVEILKNVCELREEFKNVREIITETADNPKDDIVSVLAELEVISKKLINRLNKGSIDLTQRVVVENVITHEDYREIRQDKCVQTFTEVINYIIKREGNFNGYGDILKGNCMKNLSKTTN